jgi:iron complex outermembrane receptor protein
MMVKLRHVAIFMMAMPFQVSATELFELSLEELLNVEVTSVSKQRQALSDSPAAIYVISNEDLNRSGVTSIPEALRSVPGLHVAQIDSQKWAISSRGFNGRYNNKLLVLMDGRTLYSPEFSGVYWEVQDTLITDIDRIEIIRGPSAAIWGANAVNGVINIITKHTSQTKGSYAELGTGDYEKGFGGVRYGGSLTNNTTARAYIKGFNRDSLQYQKNDIGSQQQHLLNGVDLKNKWSHHQLGGRLDSKLSKSSEITISSDVYQSRMQHVGHVATLATSAPQHREYFSDKFDADGWNLLAKYKQVKSPNSSYTIQAYYDYANRDDTIFGFETRTFDLDFQHQFLAGQRHNIIWGMGYRHIKYTRNNNQPISFR